MTFYLSVELCAVIWEFLESFKAWSEAISETVGDSPDAGFFTLDIPNSGYMETKSEK